MLMKTEIKRCDEKTASIDIYVDFGEGKFFHVAGAKFEGNNREHARLYCMLWEAIMTQKVKNLAPDLCKYVMPRLQTLQEDENGIVIVREL